MRPDEHTAGADPAGPIGSEPRERQNWKLAALLFSFVLAAYIVSGPGRVDMIDGQVRFDVALSWVSTGRPFLRDPALSRYALEGVLGSYSPYNAGASVAALPLVWMGSRFDDPTAELRRFLFSFTSGVFGSMLCVIAFLFLTDLGLRPDSSACWSLALAFCSYLWPLATSTFDQAQQAFFLMLAAYLSFRAARSASSWAALGSGLSLGALINYQENLALLTPGLMLPIVLAPPIRSAALAGFIRLRSAGRLALFQLGGAAIGLALWFEFNQYRFGTAFVVNRFKTGMIQPPMMGDPIVGLVSLLFSPGKSIFLYSPLLILGVVGWRAFRRAHPALGWGILVVSVTQLAFISCLSFFASEWAWGPRYLGPVAPLWVLPAALWFASARGRLRTLATVTIAVSFAVQLLGVSLDHHGFYYRRGLQSFFWYEEPWFYFEQSALLARPAEWLDIADNGLPREATSFAPSPYPKLVTYSVFGPGAGRETSNWMRRFRVFYLPRPWPLWSLGLPRNLSPPVSPIWGLVWTVIGVTLAWFLVRSVRALRSSSL